MRCILKRRPVRGVSRRRPAVSAAANQAGASLIEPLEQRMMLSTSGPALSVANLDILPGPERMIFNRIQREAAPG